ncbi:hypothetical protein [Nonomuraea sp. NPDC050786]|uniref:hypothetical protein n=1 Tax=Nonomuraea sp. NPDC050786 TaxID=3154840 RepID=UPI0033D99300
MSVRPELEADTRSPSRPAVIGGLKAAGVPVPIQINAGTAMGEATTMQGLLPLLAGAGSEIYTAGKWTGASQVVGYAKIPARQPGGGIRGQDHVSMSGGAVRVLNPNSKNPELAWDLLAFMHSAPATKAQLSGQARISSRTDVNDETLTADPMLKFVADQVLPITAYQATLEGIVGGPANVGG